MACDSEEDDGVVAWLRMMRLDQYEATFTSRGYTTLRDCRGLSKEFLADMGISLPGHRSRILMQLKRTFSHDAQGVGDGGGGGGGGGGGVFSEPTTPGGGGDHPPEQNVDADAAVSARSADPSRTPEYENLKLPLPPPLPAKERGRKAAACSDSPPAVGPEGLPGCGGAAEGSVRPAERLEQKAVWTDSASPDTPSKLLPCPRRVHRGLPRFKIPMWSPDEADPQLPSADPHPGEPWPDAEEEKDEEEADHPLEMMDNDIYEEFQKPEETPAQETISPIRHSKGTLSKSNALQSRPLPIPWQKIIRRQSGMVSDRVYEDIPDIPAPRGELSSRRMEDDGNTYEEVEYVEKRPAKEHLHQQQQQRQRKAPVAMTRIPNHLTDASGSSVNETGYSSDDEDRVYSLVTDVEGAAESDRHVYSTGDGDGKIVLAPRPVSSGGIKAGWLDKQAPQGPYLFQKRWVKSDGRYLYYYSNDKEVYSKGVLPLSAVQEVLAQTGGDAKFEVVTQTRAFVFRADSEVERAGWVSALREAVQAQRSPEGGVASMLHSAGVIPGEALWGEQEKRGTLELRGKAKLYVVGCSDRLWLFKSEQDFRTSLGITCIEMNVANVRAVEKKGIDLTTAFRTFSFVAENERERDEWLETMQDAIATSLSHSDVAEQIWANEHNRRCADCGAAWPDWASVNLCVVICKRCAGEHRNLGQTVSKVRSLKMDKNIWTKNLIELFQELGNAQVNKFWAASVPPSEAVDPSSEAERRREYVFSKYREGRYRCYHPCFGNESELNQALCRAVVTPNMLESLALVFCGASVLCCAGEPDGATPLQLAQRAGQRLQTELLLQNRNSTIPGATVPPSSPAIVSGYLYKTASTTKVLVDRKPKEDFCRRWCVLENGALSYYESERSATASGRVELQDLVSLAVSGAHSHNAHGMEHTFEICTKNEKLFLFGSDCATTHREWVLGLLKALPWPGAEALCRRGFDRVGPLLCRDGRSQIRWRPAVFALHGAFLRFRAVVATPAAAIAQADAASHRQSSGVLGRASPSQEGFYEVAEDGGADDGDFGDYGDGGGGEDGGGGGDGDDLEGTEVVVNLQKLQEISVRMSDHVIDKYETLILVEKRRMLYVQSDTRLNFAAWRLALENVARGGGRLLAEQQLLEGDVPVVLGRCMEYITQYGLTSEGIYRKSGTNSRTHALLAEFWRDARAVRLREGEHSVDDVANVLKRFLRELQDGAVPAGARLAWTRAAADIRDDGERLQRYKELVKELPHVNRATLAALIEHLYCVQLNANSNQMSARNLGIVFGPTLFQSEGASCEEVHVVEALINNYDRVFEVDAERFQNVLRVIELIIKGLTVKPPSAQAGNLIVSVYFERKSTDTCISLKVSGLMTAQELLLEVLDLRGGQLQHKDSAMAVFEVSGELERPLHYKERVLELLFHPDPQENYLLVKRHADLDGMRRHLEGRDKKEWQGPVRFREERSLHALLPQTAKFNERFMALCAGRVLVFKDRKTNKAERDWSLQTVKTFLGIRRKLKPPTSFGLTLVQDKQRWFLCFESHQEQCDCLATMLNLKHKGDVWPPDGDTRSRTSSTTQKLGSQVLIPLRGSDLHRLTLTNSMAFKEPEDPTADERRPELDDPALAAPWPQENGKAAALPEPRAALTPPSRQDQVAASATHAPLLPPSCRQGQVQVAASPAPSPPTPPGLRPQHKVLVPSLEQPQQLKCSASSEPRQAGRASPVTPEPAQQAPPTPKPRQQLARKSPQQGPHATPVAPAPSAQPAGAGPGQRPAVAAQTPSVEPFSPVWPQAAGPRVERHVSVKLDGQFAIDPVTAQKKNLHFNVMHELSSFLKQAVDLETVESSEA
ncbi:arf-GAP with Rho-GAP domain, ANK repeat and PH domain-containing protein 1-like isoform X1 [Lampetra planeri]